MRYPFSSINFAVVPGLSSVTFLTPISDDKTRRSLASARINLLRIKNGRLVLGQENGLVHSGNLSNFRFSQVNITAKFESHEMRMLISSVRFLTEFEYSWQEILLNYGDPV